MKGNPKIRIFLFIWILTFSFFAVHMATISPFFEDGKTVKAAEEDSVKLDDSDDETIKMRDDMEEEGTLSGEDISQEEPQQQTQEDLKEQLQGEEDLSEDSEEEMQEQEEEIEEITLRPSYDETTDSTVYSCIYFGSYPQTQMTGDRLTESIANAKYDENGDALVHGNRYHKVENIYGTFYFLYEPIKWKVISNPEGYIVAMAEKGLDYCPYYEARESDEDFALDVQSLTDEELENYKERRKAYNAVSWKRSTLRSWLNCYGKKKNTAKKSYKNDGAGFLNRAFSEEEQQDMNKIDEFDYMKFSQNLSNAQGDKVLILNLQGALTERYGFTGEASTATARILEGTDYAKARGREINDKFSNDGSWWIAGGLEAENKIQYITKKGAIDIEGATSYHSMLARPVIILDENSEHIKEAGTVAISNGSGDSVSVQLKADNYVFLNDQKDGYKDATVEIFVKNIGSEPVKMIDAILEFEDGAQILDGENKIHFANINPKEEKNIAWKFAIKPQKNAKTAKYTVRIVGSNLAQTNIKNEIRIPKVRVQSGGLSQSASDMSTQQEEKTFIEKLRDFFKGLA